MAPSPSPAWATTKILTTRASAVQRPNLARLSVHRSRARAGASTYYVSGTGAALAVQENPRQGQGLRVAVIGLGSGSMAAHAKKGDMFRFYDIDPKVLESGAMSTSRTCEKFRLLAIARSKWSWATPD